jgi:hypothetical protein
LNASTLYTRVWADFESAKKRLAETVCFI